MSTGRKLVWLGALAWILSVPLLWFGPTAGWALAVVLGWAAIPAGLMAESQRRGAHVERWRVALACIPYVAIVPGLAYLGQTADQ